MSELLSREPDTDVASLGELIGIAHAIEAEAVRRYEMLADEMDRLGAADTAAAFRTMLAEEQKHVGRVADWAAGLDQPLPPAAPFVWRLPADLAESWDEVAGSALLTPYRALAVAVTNEERAFAYYTFIAAHAGEPTIATAAEEMAQEELQHAMHLRKLRRRAYHSGRREPPAAVAATTEDFLLVVGEQQRAAAQAHANGAARLRRLGDDASADLLAGLAAAEAAAGGLDDTPEPAGAADDDASATAILYRAQAPLERLAETCEAVASTAPSETVLAAAQSVLADAVARLAQIRLRAEALE